MSKGVCLVVAIVEPFSRHIQKGALQILLGHLKSYDGLRGRLTAKRQHSPRHRLQQSRPHLRSFYLSKKEEEAVTQTFYSSTDFQRALD